MAYLQKIKEIFIKLFIYKTLFELYFVKFFTTGIGYGFTIFAMLVAIFGDFPENSNAMFFQTICIVFVLYLIETVIVLIFLFNVNFTKNFMYKHISSDIVKSTIG
jgi:hypothetical protein